MEVGLDCYSECTLQGVVVGSCCTVAKGFHLNAVEECKLLVLKWTGYVITQL